MPVRRIKSTINNDYVQPLKLRMSRRLVITPNCSYNSILYSTNHRPFTPANRTAKVWAKFNTNTFNGIQLASWIEDEKNYIVLSGSCEFKVYYLDASNNWAQTLVYTQNGTLSGQKWIAVATQANIGNTNYLDGERTLLIEATHTAWKNTYVARAYVNHLGIYDSFIQLKNEVDFLNITKADV